MIDPSDLMGANVEVRNKKGEVIFALKRKDQYPPTYYIFEMHKDRMNEEEKNATDDVFSAIAMVAGLIGFPLYDMKEINDGIQAQIRAVMETDEFKEAAKRVDEGTVDERGWSFIKDISFNVFDHATGDIKTLTVGVNLKDVRLDNGPKATEETV